MNTALRRLVIALALLLMLLPVGFIGLMGGYGRYQMAQRGTPGPPRLIAGQQLYQGARYCQTCHQEQYQEWKMALMGNATLEAHFEERSHQLAWMMPPEKCLACHAPLVSKGQPKEEAISCEVCHGPGRTETVAKNFCITCHSDPMSRILTTGSEYASSPAAREGKTCESCHMPVVQGHSSHRFAGSRSGPESYASVIIIETIEWDKGILAVAVKNTVEGHSMPTGAEVNIIHLDVTGYDATGRAIYQLTYPFEKSVLFMGTMPMQVTGDNRLGPGETQVVRFKIGERPPKLKAAVRISPAGLDGRRREFVITQREVAFDSLATLGKGE